MASAAREKLSQTLKDLLITGDYTDLVITCGKDAHNVHKAIVCTRSEFFKGAERFPTSQGKSEHTIDLPEDDPKLVKLYVQFLYGAEYDPPLPPKGATDKSAQLIVAPKIGKFPYRFPHTCSSTSYKIPNCPHHSCRKNGTVLSDFVCESCCIRIKPCPSGDADQLLLHAQMYELGDKYGTPSLKALALEKFYRACHFFWNDDAFASAAHHAFSTTPDTDMGLRSIVMQMISDNITLFNKPAVEVLVDEFHGLAMGILRMQAKEVAKYSESGQP